ncbi:hypothetical protein [Methylobacterium sp. SD21]|uniref:hypothetical protein n=1 Tax=Methylobacterium litchii TaxID=3138810 RepID=UPI00313AB589
MMGSALEWKSMPTGGTSTYKGGLYCGPGWGFTYKDILDGKIKSMPKALDAIDEACKGHDECYDDNGYITAGCNLVLTSKMVEVIKSDSTTTQQKVDAAVMAAIFFTEGFLVDPIANPKKNTKEFRDQVAGLFRQGKYTMEQAINRAIQFTDNGVKEALGRGGL